MLGAVVSELLKAVLREKDNAMSFRPYLERLNSTLEKVIPKVEEIQRINQDDKPEVKKLRMILSEGINLVDKCSTVQSWNYYLKNKYSRLLHELDNNLIRFFQLDVQTAIWCDVGQILDKMNDMNQKIDQLTAERGCSSSYNTGVEISTSMGGVGKPNLSQGLDLKDSRKFRRSKKIRNTNMSSAAPYDDLIVPKFRDDDSVETSTEYAGGIGRSSLPQELNLKALNKVGVIQLEHRTLYESVQLVSVRFLQVFQPRGVVDDGFNRVKKEHQRHMELVERVSHENVAPLRAYYCSFGALKQRYLTLVYDYNEKDSVFEMLHGKKQVPFPWDARLRVAIGVARGIAIIHTQDCGNFYHGDLISQHISMNAKGYGCISDLGRCTSGYAYAAKCCQQSDIYHYGVLLLELVTGNIPGFFFQNSEVHSNLVNEFNKYFTSSTDQLVRKVRYFARRKQWKSEETFNFQVLDCELLKHYEKFGGQMIQMLRIALDCVSDMVPKTDHVLKMVEDIRLF